MAKLTGFSWKKEKVLETKVSVLQGEVRQLRWALFGAFSEQARLRALATGPGVDELAAELPEELQKRQARELFDLAWRYLWSDEALLIDVKQLAIVEISNLRCREDGFDFRLTHKPVAGLTKPKKASWIASASWEEFSCTAWSWTGSIGGWTIDFDPRSIQGAKVAAKGIDKNLTGREQVKELKQLMDEWRQIVAEKTVLSDHADIEEH
ncbi:MAG: hypothetical protein AAF384_14140 [Pseudomonadota bacterium]